VVDKRIADLSNLANRQTTVPETTTKNKKNKQKYPLRTATKKGETRWTSEVIL
jgi:hypothetical protein